MVTDSTSSLSPEQAAAAGVTIIPLQVVMDEVSRPETDPLVSPKLVAEALRLGKQVSTSRPTPDAFQAVYAELAAQGFTAIVSAHMSGEMSATCAAAEVAADSSPIEVLVVDTHTLAMAAGYAVLAGAEAAAAGAEAAEVAELISRRAAASQTYFSVASLEFLRRGGRIGAAAAMLGSALSIKPLLRVREGKVQPFERVRTASRAKERLLDLAVAAWETAADGVDLAVHHLDDPAGAAALVAELQRRIPGLPDVPIREVSVVLGVHVGPGTLGIVVSPHV